MSDNLQVVNTGIPGTTALLQERFDYIFYTGSTNVGKIIGKNLTVPINLHEISVFPRFSVSQNKTNGNTKSYRCGR